MLPSDWLNRDLSEIACIAPLQEIQLDILGEKSVRLFIKREDLLDPLIGGNKVYKLHGHLQQYRHESSSLPVASFGGAHSNHILALAKAGQLLGIPTIGVIRGDEPAALSHTLEDALTCGMHLEFVSRTDYRRRDDPEFIDYLSARLGDCFWIPEGGSGVPGVQGGVALAQGITLSIDVKPDAVFHACGTGTSLAGLCVGFSRQPVGGVYTYGVSVLKGFSGLEAQVRQLISQFGAETQQWRVLDDYHFGGYAKYPQELASFVQDFENRTNVLLDPVYTSKVMWAILDLVRKDHFSPGSCIVAIHSGGLQGRRGFGLEFN